MILPGDLHAQYGATLREAVRTGENSAYARAAQLGEAMVAAGVPASECLVTHHAILTEALASTAVSLVMARASACLRAVLTAFEQAQAERDVAYQSLVEHTRAIEQLPDVFLEGIPAVIYVGPWEGQPGEMLYVSPQAETVLGYAAPDWIAQPKLWLTRLHPEDQERIQAERLEASVQRISFVSEYRLQHRDGRWVWLHDEARIVCDEAGNPLFWQGVWFEITQRKQAEQIATVVERTRLARELHDSVMQTLIAANMHVRTLQKIWQLEPTAAGSHIQKIDSLTQTAVAELRLLLLEMRPLELTRTPLPRLLEQLAAAMRSRSETRITVLADPITSLAPDVQISVYRIAQEALNNVVKHGAAQNCTIRLQGDANVLVLSVRDDGIGFDPAAVPGGHLGVHGMYERAATIAAQLTIHSAPGAGTTVELAWSGIR